MKKGVIAGGNFITDHVKIIDRLPHREGLGNILSETSRNGGSAYNLLKDLASMQAEFPLFAIGCVGNDTDGKEIIHDCLKHGINTSKLLAVEGATTSYTDVMTEQGSGQRNFYHYRGANSLLGEQHFDFEGVEGAIFHLGYLLLLDALDQTDEDGQTGAARVLAKASAAGLLTSVDLVSEASDRFASIVPPALPFTDYLFLNEYEAAQTTGLQLTDEHQKPVKKKLEAAAAALLKAGVRKWVIIHFREGALAMSHTGECLLQGSLSIPSDKVAGSAGAGDAFAAGVLWATHEQKSMQEALLTGVAAAASSLFAPGCSDSVLPVNELSDLARQYPPSALLQ